MDRYKHYIRVNVDAVVIHGFSDAFEQPLETDILIAESAPRHFNELFTDSLLNDRGQCRFKWDGEFVERVQKELDNEWSARPLVPPTEIDLLREENTLLQLALADLAEAQEADKTEIQLALVELAELLDGGA